MTVINNEYCAIIGIVFQDLNQNVMSYKIRLRHEVGQFDTWFTERAAPSFELPGPRVDSL